MSFPFLGRGGPSDNTGNTHTGGPHTRGSRGSMSGFTGGTTMADRARFAVASIFDVTGRARLVWILVDVGALFALLALASVAFHLTYGSGWGWVAALGGAVLGLGVGTLAALRRWPVWLTAVAVVAVYLLFGGALAMPSTVIAGFIPTPSTLAGLLFGVVDAWKGLLTIDAPVGETGSLLVVPLLTNLLAGVIGASLALRSRFPALAWLAPTLALVVAISFGVQESFLPLLVAIGFLAIVLAWTGYRRGYQREAVLGHRPQVRWQSAVLGLVVLALAGGVAAAATPIAEPTTYRHVLRDVVEPPLDVHQYPSPLQSFRKNMKDHKEDVLLTVRGLPEGAKLRIATLDAYDGVSYNVTDAADGAPDGGAFTRIGARVPEELVGEPANVEVTIEDYSGVWVPTIGKTTKIEFDGARSRELTNNFFYNRATGTGLDTSALRRGDTYRLEAIVANPPAPERIKAAGAASLSLPDADPLPDTVKECADTWGKDATTAGDLARTLEENLRKGYYSNGLEGSHPSLSGHSVGRVDELLVTGKQMIGDEEQYAVAMALMLRHAGVPARVVYGYTSTSTGEDLVEITGEDVNAWVEVNLDGLGWVEFSPTPDRDRSPEQQEVPEPSQPRPQVENPPPPPERPENPPPDNTPPEDSKVDDEEEDEPVWRKAVPWVLGIGIPLVVLAAPFAIILGLKQRRRKSRLLATEPADRVAGGWSEVMDKARDLGVDPKVNATRAEQAQVIVSEFVNAGDRGTSPQWLAHRADASVFGPGHPSGEQIDHYWRGVDAVRAGMGESVGFFRRLRGTFSLRSLRKWK
ncbi:transglutaminaseTgpA domain-containing protein [Enemella sp. A6]|uniref:transglutaminase family protein n=1 Tax=Enemella sp. A6 TaxID=3440152 RepID=UPI003EBB24ED